jgi:hypothetical protein
MPPVGFEPKFAASARPQTYALDRAATGIGTPKCIKPIEVKMLLRIIKPEVRKGRSYLCIVCSSLKTVMVHVTVLLINTVKVCSLSEHKDSEEGKTQISMGKQSYE